MIVRAAAVALILILLAPAGASAEVRKPAARRANPRTGLYEPRLDELVRAVGRGDRTEIARLAQRLGPARLQAALQGSSATDRRAALVAVPLLSSASLLIVPVTDLVTAPDRETSLAAAQVLAGLLSADDAEVLERWDVPDDVVGAACAALKKLPARPGATPQQRAAALDAILTAGPTCGGLGEHARMATDPDTVVRRAAALVIPAGAPGGTAALRTLAKDPVPTVASAATASLCRPAAGHTVASPVVNAPEYREVLEGARRLAPSPATPIADAVDMLACLAAAASPADRKALEELARRPAPLGERAAALGGAPEKRAP